MKPQDAAVLVTIGPQWTYMGPPKSSYAVRSDQRTLEPAAPRASLLRLKAAGYVTVRTVTIRNWATREDRNNYALAYGVRWAWEAPGYSDLFEDRVEVQAKLTPQGADVKLSL